MATNHPAKASYEMKFDIGTIKHLGLQMYSTLPPVVGELVANGWDAKATRVEITIPDASLDSADSEIVIQDNGIGMTDRDYGTSTWSPAATAVNRRTWTERLPLSPAP